MLVLIVVIGIFILSGAVIIFASDRDSKLELIRVEPEPMEEVKELSALTGDMDIGVDMGPIKSHRVFVVRLRSIKGRSIVEETIAKYPEATLVNIETTSDETVMSFEQWE